MRLASLLLLAVCASAFYLPGVAPTNYEENEAVDLKVVGLDSVITQLPYDYYSLPFCRPKAITKAAENLGEILAGDTIENSAYELLMARDSYCNFLCAREYSAHDLKRFAERIEEQYRVNWIVDNFPAATKYYTEIITADGTRTYPIHYEKGFPLGVVGSGSEGDEKRGIAYLHNHVRLALKYHKESDKYRIVGFEVEPFSLHHEVDSNSGWHYETYIQQVKEHKKDDDKILTPVFTNCPNTERSVDSLINEKPEAVSGKDITDKKLIFWTYDVTWQQSSIKWASRWDIYLKMADADTHVHWFSIINSIIIALFLSGIVAVIMLRTLHKDLVRYNEIDMSEEARQEETGWKLLHGDVFRRPEHAGTFSVLVGTGYQVVSMAVVTLTFALLGFLSPANRGGLLTALLLLYVLMGGLAGYHSTRYYKMFKLTDWRRNTMVTALAFPGLLFGVFFILNLFIWGEKSSGAVPFSTLVALLVLWLGISVPLCYLGSWFAFKKPAFEPPVKVNEIPRHSLVEYTWYNGSCSIVFGGVLPFGAVFIEIFFIMSSIMLHQYYYVFGFLYIIFLILVVTCAEISIVMCYFQLCNEDYHWWWRSYLSSGSSALYLFLYSVVYFFTRLEITFPVTALLFFGYMLLVSLVFFVLTGTIGHIACFHFVRKIYSSIKIE